MGKRFFWPKGGPFWPVLSSTSGARLHRSGTLVLWNILVVATALTTLLSTGCSAKTLEASSGANEQKRNSNRYSVSPLAWLESTEEHIPTWLDPEPDGTLPHSTHFFTQGLLAWNGMLYESTGRHGASGVFRIDTQTGEVLDGVALSERFFGEGLALHQDTLFQLTWTSGVCHLFEVETLKPKGQLYYPGEGWGLTTDPETGLLIKSDGSHLLQVLSPRNLVLSRTLAVHTPDGREVPYLNELEWVNGEIWANVWTTDRIARIDPATGTILGWIVLRKLARSRQLGDEDVLNGIAFDPERDQLWLTGKLWPEYYRFDRVTERFFAEEPEKPQGQPIPPGNP